jgi:poly-beta-1,6-N-acetyl-D-glucosamine synthase
MMLTLLTYSIVLAVAYLALMATFAIVSALRAGGRREETSEEQDAVAVSRFTIPVSIIVPISNGTTAISQTLSTLLDLNYPEFEVIAVADGAPQVVLDELAREWQLEAREFFYRKIIDTSEVRRIYRSGRDPRLMVIDKTAAGSASAKATAHKYSDALNCGVNVARYRYFMPVEPGITFDRDAMLRVMASALRDPASVIGASNHVERGTVPEGTRAGMTAIFQRLASARSLMDSRLAWRHLSAGLGPAGAVIVWRRDSVIKARGFSSGAADPDVDLMLRLQTTGVDGGGRFDRGVDVFGRVESQPVRSALLISGRRQRAALEILSAMLQGRARGLGGQTLAYFLESEIVRPLAQFWIVVSTVIGASAGWFSWTSVLLAVALLAFGNAAVSTAALLLRGSSPGAPEEPELRRLIAVGPLEFLFYRPMLAAARVAAAISFVGK